jgi:hypothetical protein
VQIFLHDHVAAAGKRGVFLADDYRVGGCLAARIFRAVHEADEIAIIEVTESVDFIDRRNGAGDARHDLRGKFEA